MKLMRKFINANIAMSKWFDQRFLPMPFCIDGNSDFIRNVAPPYLLRGSKIYDVGGGKQPYISVDQKHALSLYVVGIDISQKELDRAPAGAYDETMCADITRVFGYGDGDVVICQAVLEHVRDTEKALASIASLLKPGGKALIFVPSRSAIFARLNILLPESIKRKLLHTIFPHTKEAQGFPSYYDRCTPKEFLGMAKANQMAEIKAFYYYVSSYFSFFFPVYFIWRLWIVIFAALAGRQAAETFSLVLERLPNTRE